MNWRHETVKMGVQPDKPQELEPEAYLNSTSQGARSEDARKDAHIRGRSRPFMKYPGQIRITLTPRRFSSEA
jgi:hypothetical protein